RRPRCRTRHRGEGERVRTTGRQGSAAGQGDRGAAAGDQGAPGGPATTTAGAGQGTTEHAPAERRHARAMMLVQAVAYRGGLQIAATAAARSGVAAASAA